ncbi:hypothetical protein BA723_02995 [Helicobacter sp. CLO-3]|nr:hypothetical protein BA723_02995 [Helicobacter sp. CLO-3]
MSGILSKNISKNYEITNFAFLTKSLQIFHKSMRMFINKLDIKRLNLYNAGLIKLARFWHAKKAKKQRRQERARIQPSQAIAG